MRRLEIQLGLLHPFMEADLTESTVYSADTHMGEQLMLDICGISSRPIWRGKFSMTNIMASENVGLARVWCLVIVIWDSLILFVVL